MKFSQNLNRSSIFFDAVIWLHQRRKKNPQGVVVVLERFPIFSLLYNKCTVVAHSLNHIDLIMIYIMSYVKEVLFSVILCFSIKTAGKLIFSPVKESIAICNINWHLWNIVLMTSLLIGNRFPSPCWEPGSRLLKTDLHTGWNLLVSKLRMWRSPSVCFNCDF